MICTYYNNNKTEAKSVHNNSESIVCMRYNMKIYANTSSTWRTTVCSLYTASALMFIQEIWTPSISFVVKRGGERRKKKKTKITFNFFSLSLSIMLVHSYKKIKLLRFFGNRKRNCMYSKRAKVNLLCIS